MRRVTSPSVRFVVWKWIWVVAFLLVWVPFLPRVHGSSSSSVSTVSTTTSSSTSTSTVEGGIPRSSSSSKDREERWTLYPPWNPSRNISADGFLRQQYYRIPGEWEKEVRLRTSHTLEQPCRIRQVPGDGNCLFHSISLCLHYAQNGSQWDMKNCLNLLYQHSQELRQKAVACLLDQRRRLVLQGPECVKSRELVQAAAQQYGLTAEEYCQDMLQESVWGGGPEIVALANVLRRPIHVYELVTTTSDKTNSLVSHSRPQFQLRRMACFGSPRFDHHRGRNALHILSADSHFPDISPGRQLSDGNHFLAVFPVYDDEEDDEEGGKSHLRRRRKKLRGGSFWGVVNSVVRPDHHRQDNQDLTEQEKTSSFSSSTQGIFGWIGGWLRRNFS